MVGSPPGSRTRKLNTTRWSRPAANTWSSLPRPGSSPAGPNSTELCCRPSGSATSYRLGRSLERLIDLSKDLQTRGVDLVVLDQGIDTSAAVGRMLFQILGSIAEFEHALMPERILDGLAAARARGRTGGQKSKLGARQVTLARQMYEELTEDGKRRYIVARSRPGSESPAHHLPPPGQAVEPHLVLRSYPHKNADRRQPHPRRPLTIQLVLSPCQLP